MEIFKLFGSIFVDTDKAENSIQKTDKKAGGLGKTLVGAGKMAGKMAIGIGTAAVAVGGAMVAVAESTRDYRTEMGKLDTAFTVAGHSSKSAAKTYESLQSLLGETDTAVEASNHLAKLCKNEMDLEKWTNICTGVFATFGDSLPIEGLTEAANETAKVGQVTGPLADALNWAGISEDKFNESLAKCTSEQERSALITDTLNGLYDEASKKYKQTNGDIMTANANQEKMNKSMASMGAVVEPVLNKVKGAFADFLVALIPGIEYIANTLLPLLNTVFNNVFSSIMNVWNTVGKPIFDNLLSTFDSTGDSGQSTFGGIQAAFNECVTFLQQIWTEYWKPLFDVLVETFSIVVDFFVQNWPSIQLYFMTAFDVMKTIWSTVGKPIFDILISLVKSCLTAFRQVMPGIQALFKDVVTTISTQWNTNLKPVFEAIKNMLNNIVKPAFELVFKAIGPIVKSAFDNIKGLWNNVLKPIFEGISEFLNGVFTGNWKKVFSGLLSVAKGCFNSIMEAFKAPMRGIANLWNSTVGKLSFTIPDWVKSRVAQLKHGEFGKNLSNIKLRLVMRGDGYRNEIMQLLQYGKTIIGI